MASELDAGVELARGLGQDPRVPDVLDRLEGEGDQEEAVAHSQVEHQSAEGCSFHKTS